MGSKLSFLQASRDVQASRDAASLSDIQAFRTELDEHVRRRFEEMDRSMHQIRNAHDSGSDKWSDVVQRLDVERSERQMEHYSIHQQINTLGEQTKLALREEASRLWEALRSHRHDMHIKGSSSQLGRIQLQKVSSEGDVQQIKQSRRVSQSPTKPIEESMSVPHPTVRVEEFPNQATQVSQQTHANGPRRGGVWDSMKRNPRMRNTGFDP